MARVSLCQGSSIVQKEVAVRRTSNLLAGAEELLVSWCSWSRHARNTPSKTPSHLPMQRPQFLHPLMSIALSPPDSFKVQQKGNLLTCSFVGRKEGHIKVPGINNITDVVHEVYGGERQLSRVHHSAGKHLSSPIIHWLMQWHFTRSQALIQRTRRKEQCWWAQNRSSKFPFGITMKMYSSGWGGSTTGVNRTVMFLAMVNSCVSGCGTTLLL